MRTPNQPRPTPEEVSAATTVIARELAWLAAEQEDEGEEPYDTIREAQTEFNDQEESDALAMLEGGQK